MPEPISRRPLQNSICATASGRSQIHSFISLLDSCSAITQQMLGRRASQFLSYSFYAPEGEDVPLKQVQGKVWRDVDIGEVAQEIAMASDQTQVDALLVTTTIYFSVNQARHCNIPGYLIIEPLTPASALWMLPGPALNELGPLLAFCTRAIHEVLSPIRVYCLTFAEERRTYDCHLFPRSTETTTEYLKVFPQYAALIHGPLLFDWARQRYQEDSAGNTDIVNAVARLRNWIATHRASCSAVRLSSG